MDMPAQVQFKETYDADKLQRDLERARSYQADDHFGKHEGWETIPLLATETQVSRFTLSKPTPVMEVCSYVSEVFDAINTPISWARFSRLTPGGKIYPHQDPNLGLHTGHVRIHLPVVTNTDKIEFVIAGEQCNWEAGELWYGDFGAMHHVYSEWSEPRVHIVLDALVTEGLLEMLPEDFANKVRQVPDAVVCPEFADLSHEQKSRFCTYFWIKKNPLFAAPLLGEIELWDDGRMFMNAFGIHIKYQVVPVSDDELMVVGRPDCRLKFDFEKGRPTSGVLRHPNAQMALTSELFEQIPIRCYESLDSWRKPAAGVQKAVVSAFQRAHQFSLESEAINSVVRAFSS